jgi:hypothetical protein
MTKQNVKKVTSTALSSVLLPAQDEKHLCTCYEQLVGIGYSLRVAAAYGILNRRLDKEYHKDIRLKLCSLLNKSKQIPRPPKPGPWATWACGFYFNAALNRIVWVGERLLKVFASLPMKCCTTAPQPIQNQQGIKFPKNSKKESKFESMIKFAEKRLTHLKTDHPKESQLQGIMSFVKLVRDKPQNSVVKGNNYFAAIRWDVNEQKHSLGSFRRSSASTVPITSAPRRWGQLRQNEQFEYSIKAFILICKLYSDIHKLYFERKILVP